MDNLSCESNKLKESQALDQFREWIEKHPRIKKCRTDDQFLLRFLRVRKFNIQEANQLLEQYLTTRKQFPHLFENLSIEDPKLVSIITNYLGFPLFDLDSQGRIVVFIDCGKVDGKRLTAVDCIKMLNYGLEYFSFEERSQSKGIVIVLDVTIKNYDLLRLWTPTNVKEAVQCIEKSFPVRLKKAYLVNMAPLYTALVQLVKMLLSEKMKNRIEIIKGWDNVFKELGTKNFHQEVGGQIPVSELVDDFKKRLLENKENILSLSDSDIDISMSSSGNFSNSYDAELDAGIVGSFRKIALD